MSKRIIIIGGGPAGYEAALHGASLGGTITLIEDHKIGGTCLNYGCIPTKTLIEHASFYDKTLRPEPMGVHVHEAILDYEQVLVHKSSVIETLGSGIMAQLNKAKVQVIEGYGRIISSSEVEVSMPDGSRQCIQGDAIVLATGSKPLIPDFPGIESPLVLTSKSLLALETLPATMTIVGGGVIGMEFAALLSNFGVKVTVLEYAKTLLPLIDQSIGKRLKSLAVKNGVVVKTGAKVTSFEDLGHEVTTFFEDKKGLHEVTSDHALVAIGRVGRFDQSNLDEQGIVHNERFVQVNHTYETNVNNIYAIGDVNGLSLLAHAASDQGRQLMDYLIEGKGVQEKTVPACVFTNPEIGFVGLTEEAAKELKVTYQSQKTLYRASGKALAMGETDGFIKTLVDQDRRIIGCHVFGPHASDIVHYASIAMEAKMTVDQLKNIIFAHPTLGELFSDNMRQY